MFPRPRTGIRENQSHRRGFTLVELLLSIMLAGVVLAATTAILFATIATVEGRGDIRRSVVQSHAVERRLHQAVTTARCVLATAAGEVVLWRHDDNADETVNLDELALIQRDGNDTLRHHAIAWPADWTTEQIAAANTSYPAASDFSTVATAMKNHANATAAKWSSKVTAFNVILDDATPQNARFVTLALTFDREGESHDSTVSAAIRSHCGPES